MIFEKKYWSEGEFRRKTGEPYVGYVGILDRVGYIYDTEEELDKVDSWKTQINSSDYFYDRILDEPIELPYTKSDIQFAANDFLTSSTLRNIILKLQENNDYIFKNAIISNTVLPATMECHVLATYNDPVYWFIGASKKKYEVVDNTNKADIEAGFILSEIEGLKNTNSYQLKVGERAKAYYGDYYKIPKVEITYKLKNGYLHQYKLAEQKKTLTALDPTFYTQIDELGNVTKPLYDFNKLVHCEIKITKVEGIKGQDGARKLHMLVFFLFVDKLLIFPYIYNEGFTTDEEPEINFNVGSKDILVFDTVDPNNKNAVKFLGLKDIELHGNYMFLVDEKLNMVLRYDIAYLINDESEIGFSLGSIRLLDNLSGDGSVNDNIYFNQPVSIAVDDNWIYVADKGNKCIKKYSSSFDYETTLRNGQYANQNIEAISINPYAPTLDDGTKLDPGSLWVFSTSGESLFVSVVVGNKTVYQRQIEKIQLLEDQYTWDEEFKSVKFSFTNSNYYYISTTKRVYKLHLSKPAYPFASLSYFKQRSLLSTMVWNQVPYPWHFLPDGTGDEEMNVVWSYRPQKTSAEVLDNRGFCVCGIDSTLVTDENNKTQEQFNGDMILHIGNFYDQSKVDTYIKRNGCTFYEIPSGELAKMVKCSGIFLYIEPATFIESVSNPAVPCYIKEDLQFIDPGEYVNPVTFNAHIYKVIYNLINLKNILIGTFQGAYNMDNIMAFDQLIFDNFFQQLKIEHNNDFFIYNNEPVSVIANRVFENVWDLQFEILQHIKAKYISTPSFQNNTFRII